MTRVSVIIPTYNRVGLVQEAISSVLAQTFSDFEVIVVDDGSTDNTRAVVERIADARVRYIFQANAGRSAARNRGLAEAQGDYISFLDSDDVYLPHKLEVQVQALETHKAWGLVAGGHQVIDGNGNVIREVLPNPRLELSLKMWLVECPFPPSVPLIRHVWADRTPRFDSDIEPNEDWDYWLRLAHAGCHMEWHPALMCCYRRHESNTSGDDFRKLWKGVLAPPVEKFFAENVDLPSTVLEHKVRLTRRANLWAGIVRLYERDGELAGASLNRAFENRDQWSQSDYYEISSLIAEFIRAQEGAEPLTFESQVIRNLPVSGFERQRIHRIVLAQLTKALVYDAYRHGDWTELRKRLVGLITIEPMWIANRGSVVITAKSILRTISAKDSKQKQKNRKR